MSLAFTIDRKGNVLGSRIETTSDDLDAEAIAMLKRVSPSAPPPDVNLDKLARPCFLELWNEADAKQISTAHR